MSATAQDLHPYHDCLTGLVNQIVSPHAATELLWPECKLYAFKNPKDLVFYQPKIVSLSEEISKYSSVHATHMKFTTEAEIKEFLHTQLTEGKSIICLVDTFNLPFCRTYQNTHAAHWLSVTGYRDGQYQLFDHYYQFQGDMEESQFHECMLVVTTQMTFENAHCYTIDAQGSKEVTLDHYCQAIADNLSALTSDSAVGKHIEDPIITAIIEKLIANGCAYPVDGDVYYSVASFPPYGKLSGMSIDDLRAGARVDVDERKRAPGDFALWKSAKPGEPFWASPWGNGRPGWHIECSAMCVAHLGESFDLHGGGKDLIFPHHENEIAQSQGAYGEGTFARYWLHNGFINFGGEKMSKSLGNVFNAQDIADAVGGEPLRFFCVKHHYRTQIDFEVDEVKDAEGKPTGVRFRSLEAADRELEYFYKALAGIETFLAAGGDGGEGAVLPAAEQLLTSAAEGLADDFNTPVVIAVMYEAATLANRLVTEGKGVDKAVRRRTIARLGRDLRAAGTALGILGDAPRGFLRARRDRLVRWRGIDVARVEQLIADRTAARASKDFARGDALRTELTELGIELHDSPQGTDWSVRDAS